jgi:hypothetical protein
MRSTRDACVDIDGCRRQFDVIATGRDNAIAHAPSRIMTKTMTMTMTMTRTTTARRRD